MAFLQPKNPLFNHCGPGTAQKRVRKAIGTTEKRLSARLALRLDVMNDRERFSCIGPGMCGGAPRAMIPGGRSPGYRAAPPPLIFKIWGGGGRVFTGYYL
jgi:hypothetical protein